MTRAIGPDISFYQDDNTTPQGVDFDVMKAAPSEFVIIRAGQCNWVDPDFATNWAAAKAAELPRGSYWYFDSRCSPEIQAHLWAEVLGDDLGEIALFADFEESYGGPWGGPNNFYAFLTELEGIVNKEILIYTRYYYWIENVPSNLRQLFAPWGLWAARYSTNEPRMAAPWEDEGWTFWQYTEHGDGYAYGVESRGIDLNLFNGTPEEFRERFKIDEVEPPTVDPPPTEPPTGEDMEIPEAILEAGKLIAGAIEGLGSIVTQPPTNPPTEPPKPPTPTDPNEHWWIVAPKSNGNWPVYRTATTEDGRKRGVHPQPGSRLRSATPPKKIYNTKIWNTTAELHNVLRNWVWFPRQDLLDSNGKMKILPFGWADSTGKPDEHWQGCFGEIVGLKGDKYLRRENAITKAVAAVKSVFKKA